MLRDQVFIYVKTGSGIVTRHSELSLGLQTEVATFSAGF